MIGRRLDFHSQDGVIAADALAGDLRWRYILSTHTLVCGVATLCALIGRPATAIIAPIGYVVGAGIPCIAHRLAFREGALPRSSVLRPVGRLLQRPISGAFAAAPVVLSLPLLHAIKPGPLAAFIGLVTMVVALLLTTLDYKVVRFMTESGYRAGRIVGIHVWSLSTFLVLTVLASLALSDRLVTIVIVGVVLVALTLMTARILAYRIHSKRMADTVVSICAGVACLAAVALPLLLPLIVGAILWHLHRRSLSATWLLL